VFIWVEWRCGRCGEMHRARFEVVIQDIFKLYTTNSWIHEEIRIIDSAIRKKAKHKVQKPYRGSRIFVEAYTPIRKILDTLRKYMDEYYSLQPNTEFKMEVCP